MGKVGAVLTRKAVILRSWGQGSAATRRGFSVSPWVTRNDYLFLPEERKHRVRPSAWAAVASTPSNLGSGGLDTANGHVSWTDTI